MLATHFDPTWYKAWHTWALSNFEVIAHMESQSDSRVADLPGRGLVAHSVQAVEGLTLIHILWVFHVQQLFGRLFPIHFTSECKRVARHPSIVDVVVQVW
jgi:hypothetical protein